MGDSKPRVHFTAQKKPLVVSISFGERTNMTTAMSTAAVMALPVTRMSPYLTARPATSKLKFSKRFSSPLHHGACAEESPKLSLVVGRRQSITTVSAGTSAERLPEGGDGGENENVRRVLQTVLWLAEGIYILWLFLLPYAPGDPVWAISSETVNSLVGLSLNFFFILPLMNSVGISLIDAPVLHPMDEGLFNFVIGWTFMFAPLLFTDRKRDRFKGSLDILWGFQMFLTNTFLIPYMAIRLNGADEEGNQREPTQLASVMTKGAPYVALIGGGICLISALWALFGRADGNFGDTAQRLEYLVSYLGSERLAYAFIWDICLYVVFQPWLIGDNIQNVKKNKAALVNYLKFVPVVGIVAYLLSLNLDEEL